MSNTPRDGRGTPGGPVTSPLKGKNSYRDFFANSSSDDIATMELPSMDLPGLSMSAELRAISIPLAPLPQTPRESWFAEEETWLLPAVSVAPADQRRGGATSAPSSEKQQAGSKNYLSLAVEMVKSSGIYAIGALASPLVSLILSPYLAHNLSQTQYGALYILYTVVDLITVVTQVGLGGAFFRAYNNDYDTPRDRLSVLSTTIILLVLASLPVALLMIVLAPWVSELLFKTPDFASGIQLTALVIVAENLALPGVSWFRAEKRPIPYSVLSVVNLVVVLLVNIILVGGLHVGLNGALVAKGLGYAVIIAYTVPIMLLRLIRANNLNLRFDIVKSMLTFGVPTIFSDIAAWVLQLSDRYLLAYFGALTQTASYSAAYVLGGVLSPVMLAPWGLAWIPIMYSVAKREDAPQIFKLVFRYWSTVLLFGAFGLSILSSIILATLYPPSYQADQPVIPVITLSTMLQGVWYIFMIGVNIRRKTIFEFIYVVTAAVVNLLLNLFFIPHFGDMGAAISTLLSYILLAVISYIVNQRLYPIGFEVGSFTLKLVIGMVLYAGAYLLVPTRNMPMHVAALILALLIYLVILMVLTGITVQTIRGLVNYVQSAIRKVQAKNFA